MIGGLSLAVGAAIVGCAGMVVTARSLVRSVLWLAATLLFTAAAFVSLAAPLLAGIQVILYTGGVITLMLFGVMLTRRTGGAGAVVETDLPSPVLHRGPASVMAALLLGTLLAAIWTTPALDRHVPVDTGDAVSVARLFLGPHMVAFEALSVLLLVAMIGAIVLVRRSDP